MKGTSVYLVPMLQFSCQVIFSSCGPSRIFNVNIRYRNWKIALFWWVFHCFCCHISLPRQETCLWLIAKASPNSLESVGWAASSQLVILWAWTRPGHGWWYQLQHGARKEAVLVGPCQQTCYGREKCEQGQNAAVLSLNLQQSDVVLHVFICIDLLPTGCVQNSVGFSNVSYVFDTIWCFEMFTCSRFSTGISGGVFWIEGKRFQTCGRSFKLRPLSSVGDTPLNKGAPSQCACSFVLLEAGCEHWSTKSA